MKTILIASVLLLFWGCSSDYEEGTIQSAPTLSKAEPAQTTVQVAIFKADDYGASPDSGMTPGWQTFINYIRGRGIKASMGVIGLGILRGNQQFLDSTKVFSESPMFEFWDHGYEHIVNQLDSNGNLYSEFKGTDFRYQKSHLKLTQQLLRTKIGITLKGFGAPGNATDSVTKSLMETKPFGLRYWFFGDTTAQNIFVFKDEVSAESETGVPSFQKFLETYDPSLPYIVLQIHPKNFDAADYVEVNLIVDYLLNLGVEFVLPTEYMKGIGAAGV